jgi:predicted anti-sigma-YlaC factor YlaD
LASDARAASRNLQKSDVPLLYWTAASWGALVSTSKDDPAAISEIPQVEALIDRALELDPDWNQGAIHTLMISIEMNRSGATGKPVERARTHFEHAMTASRGELAGPLVTFAETVSVETRDTAEFERLLNQALAIEIDRRPDSRLANSIMQRRARWLLSRKDDLFFTSSK